MKHHVLSDILDCMFPCRIASRNEPIDLAGTAIIPFQSDLGPVRPTMAEDYSVVTVPGDYRLQLQAQKSGGEWVMVEFYDNGFDEYGQLYPGRWKPIGELCCWNRQSLLDIATFLKNGRVPSPKIISTLSDDPLPV